MITVIIPAYNEEAAIGDTLSQLRAVLDNENLPNYELLVVDDGSSDNTKVVAVDAGATVVSNPHNVGYGRALKLGIESAAHDRSATVALASKSSATGLTISHFSACCSSFGASARSPSGDTVLLRVPLELVCTGYVTFVSSGTSPCAWDTSRFGRGDASGTSRSSSEVTGM